MMLLAGNVVAVLGQEGPSSTPDGLDVEIGQDEPEEGTEPATDATQSTGEEPDASTASASANLAASPDAPPVLAQGLIYLTGDDVWWEVREVELLPPSEAGSVTGPARVIFQRSGVSIMRNDVTGKRARLEQGEAYFASAGDPYTTMAADDSRSVAWVFEIANSDEVAEDAFYLSPGISGIAEGVYDFEFSYELLESGDTTRINQAGGPFLVMVLTGSVAVQDDDGAATLGSGDGRIVNGDATVQAEGDGQAILVTAAIGPEVSDASAAAPAATEAPVDTGTDSPETTAPESSAAEADQAPAAQAEPGGDYVTSIFIQATAGLGATVIVDGVTVFDGWLEAGESTVWFTGTVFEVYTTSGVNTTFTNTCSNEPFVMGYEEGDAYYVLEATASSCAPVE